MQNIYFGDTLILAHNPAHNKFLSLTLINVPKIIILHSSIKGWISIWMNETRSLGNPAKRATNTRKGLWDQLIPLGWALPPYLNLLHYYYYYYHYYD